MNQMYPIFLKMNLFETLIVGGGNVGLEKLHFLLKSSPNAIVTVVSKDFHPDLVDLSKTHLVRLVEKEFEVSDLNNKQLVIAATNSIEKNYEIWQSAKNQKILVNVADTPQLCDFYLGGIVSKGNLKVAISTNGKSPTMAKRIRQLLEEALPDNTDDLLNNLNIYRKTLKTDFEGKVKKLNELTQQFLN